jgi:hypothetical protein
MKLAVACRWRCVTATRQMFVFYRSITNKNVCLIDMELQLYASMLFFS